MNKLYLSWLQQHLENNQNNKEIVNTVAKVITEKKDKDSVVRSSDLDDIHISKDSPVRRGELHLPPPDQFKIQKTKEEKISKYRRAILGKLTSSELESLGLSEAALAQPYKPVANTKPIVKVKPSSYSAVNTKPIVRSGANTKPIVKVKPSSYGTSTTKPNTFTIKPSSYGAKPLIKTKPSSYSAENTKPIVKSSDNTKPGEKKPITKPGEKKPVKTKKTGVESYEKYPTPDNISGQSPIIAQIRDGSVPILKLKPKNI